MPRLFRSIQAAFDLAVLSAAYWLAFLFRFEFSIPSAWLRASLISWPDVVMIGYGALALPVTHWVVIVPYSVLCMNFFLGFVGLVGVRATRRFYGELVERRQRAAGRKRERVLLIGAGQAGVVVAREIAARRDLALHPVGFLDDDDLKVGMLIGGLPVLGRVDEVAEIARTKRVTRVLITIAN